MPTQKQEQLEYLQQLNAELNKWEYGVLQNGKVITKSSEVDWGKYKTIPIRDIEKHRIGICWDFVNYQHSKFMKNGIRDKSYFFIIQKSKDSANIDTHTFSIVTVGGESYWFESSWQKHRGVNKVNSFKDVIIALVLQYGKNGSEYEVYEYNPTGLDNKLSDQQFFNRACKNMVYQNSK